MIEVAQRILAVTAAHLEPFMERREVIDLFGETVVLEFSEAKRKPTVPKGYASAPGTGPKDEACGTCAHARRFGRYAKCHLLRLHWTGGPGTDIKLRSPACRQWEKEKK